ncbi:MAG: NAD(+) synthase [Synergistaceae bacterium]|nr:NAD(+) synthase [Synergistaceae bacterium]
MSVNEEYVRDPGKAAACIERWLASLVERAGAKGIVAGLSGGLDSAVVAALAVRVFKDGALGLIMPCRSDPADAADALLVAERLGMPHRTIELTPAFDVLTSAMDSAVPLSDMARANIKARLRMVTLYGVAQSTSRLVCGTGNRSEWETGYFTKHGDDSSDLLPLRDLLKCEVRAIARFLGLPEHIIEKPPSAGLWTGQTDEGEMGFSYGELDKYLAIGNAAPETALKIEALRAKSEHKRLPVPYCKCKIEL